MIYIDTMVLIYMLEGHPDYAQSIAGELERLRAQGHEFASSALAIAEYLAGTGEASAKQLKQIQGLSFVTLDETIAAQAGLLQRQDNLKIGDAMHLASCLHTACDLLFTNDAQLAKKATKYVNVLQPVAA